MISVQLTEQGVIYPWSIHGSDVLRAETSEALTKAHGDNKNADTLDCEAAAQPYPLHLVKSFAIACNPVGLFKQVWLSGVFLRATGRYQSSEINDIVPF